MQVKSSRNPNILGIRTFSQTAPLLPRLPPAWYFSSLLSVSLTVIYARARRNTAVPIGGMWIHPPPSPAPQSQWLINTNTTQSRRPNRENTHTNTQLVCVFCSADNSYCVCDECRVSSERTGALFSRNTPAALSLGLIFSWNVQCQQTEVIQAHTGQSIHFLPCFSINKSKISSFLYIWMRYCVWICPLSSAAH